jgi:cytochrome P450
MNVYYHPLSRAIFDDPYPVYRQLRDHAPVYYCEEVGMWAISRFEDVWNALRDHETFCSRFGPAIENPDDDGRKYSIVSMDPPRHDHLRGILSRLFTPNKIAALEPAVREIVREHLDGLQPGTVVDAAVEIATPIPSDVIGYGSGGTRSSPARKETSRSRKRRLPRPARSPTTSAASSRSAGAGRART